MSTGSSVGEVCRQIGVTEQTFYRWRNEYGGLSIDQAKRLKLLEAENSRLKRAVADLTLDNQILKEVAGGKLLSPTRRRQGVDLAIEVLGILGTSGLQGARSTSVQPSGTILSPLRATSGCSQRKS